MTLDRRLNAFRPDLADAALEGVVEAERYASGMPARIAVPVAGLRRRPDPQAGIDTEILFGEDVVIFDKADGWAWVQAAADGYVGYVPEAVLVEGAPAPTHRVTVPRTFVYPGPDLRFPASAALSMGSRLVVVGETETRGTRYCLLADGRAVIANHCRRVEEPVAGDYVAVAARFLETPYLWGGRSGFGIDCSGLVQLALMMVGKTAPRDSDMQAQGLGIAIDRDQLRRGDLVFWRGHAGIMEDDETLLHANGHTMTVARENFEAAVQRIGWLYEQPTGYRRPL
ncbi:C40 family peptidase [Agrobacterium sp. a22-2]|uniref:C40 family peptidase n=1 Tax=Agrobacterium sp. a22-2 TaxID=2283840 RepID=UPI0014456518|nr:NlpC/P60 family protein [Agrobacterium sp. a22-2]NKN35316.1 C40 family peptidase [Agrobacterium sp. a22-2]